MPRLSISQSEIILGSRVIVGSINHCLATGAVNTYACALDPAITLYTTGAFYSFQANAANTAAATINLNGVGARTIKKVTGAITTDLIANDIRTGQMVVVYYDGTNMQMVSQLGNAATGAGTITSDTTSETAYYTGATTVAGSSGLLLDATSIAKRVENLTPSTSSITLGTHNVIACDATAASRTYTLPAASGQTLGQTYRVIKVDASANTCSLAAASGERLNGVIGTPRTLATQYEESEVLLVSTSTPNWQMTSGVLAPVSVALGGTGTASTLTGLMRGSASAMTAAELSGAVATSGSNATTLASKYLTHIKSALIDTPVVGDTNKLQWTFPTAVTITRVVCAIGGTTSITIQLDERAEATPNTAGTNVMTSTLVCDADSQATTTFTNATIAARVPLNLQVTAASGTPTSLRVHVEYSID